MNLGLHHFQGSPSGQLCSCSLPAQPCRYLVVASALSYVPGGMIPWIHHYAPGLSAKDTKSRGQEGASFLFIGVSPWPRCWALSSWAKREMIGGEEWEWSKSRLAEDKGEHLFQGSCKEVAAPDKWKRCERHDSLWALRCTYQIQNRVWTSVCASFKWESDTKRACEDYK